MLTDQQLDDANAYGEWLRLAVHERELPANDRVRASGSCLAIALDHHHAIVVLLGARLYASSFALVRIAFEAYVRGEWLDLCASAADIRRFLQGKTPSKIDCLLSDLEGTDTFQVGALSHIKKHTWKTMCDYTHTGGLHVQRWNTAKAIEPNYSAEEILEVLRFAEIIASLSVLGVTTQLNDEGLAQKLLKGFKRRVGE